MIVSAPRSGSRNAITLGLGKTVTLGPFNTVTLGLDPRVSLRRSPPVTLGLDPRVAPDPAGSPT